MKKVIFFVSIVLNLCFIAVILSLTIFNENKNEAQPILLTGAKKIISNIEGENIARLSILQDTSSDIDGEFSYFDSDMSLYVDKKEIAGILNDILTKKLYVCKCGLVTLADYTKGTRTVLKVELNGMLQIQENSVDAVYIDLRENETSIYLNGLYEVENEKSLQKLKQIVENTNAL